jgi:cellulose biosynthesis protein BcsQ
MPRGTISARPEARRISIFNHKGGVGKTTLTMNLGVILAERGHRVLLVDSDPQCNLTSYFLEDDVVDDLLDHSDGPDGRTVWSAVKPISEALGGVKLVDPVELSFEGLYLIPGDIRLSEFEADLNDFWGECFQRKSRGFRGMTAISDLVSAACDELEIDYVLYDSGPNIGPLNRAILLDCDHFIVPVACDLFSLRALKTLGRTLVDWISSWQTVSDLAPAGTPLLPGLPHFLGYIPEGFRIYGGAPTQRQAYYLAQIDKEIHGQIVTLLRDVDPDLTATRRKTYKLGEVKHFGALVPASQEEGNPLYAVSAGSPAQRAGALRALSTIAKVVESATGG